MLNNAPVAKWIRLVAGPLCSTLLSIEIRMNVEALKPERTGFHQILMYRLQILNGLRHFSQGN